MKKLLVMILIMVFAFTLLTGCGGDTGNADAEAADDTVYTMVVSNSSTDSGYYGKGYHTFIDYVEKHSNGRIKCNYFGDGALANNDRQMYEMTQSGQITLTAADFGGLGEYLGDDRSTFIVLPGFAKPEGDFDEMYNYCDNSEIIQGFVEQFEEQGGIKCMGLWSAGDANVYYNGQPADEVGLEAAMSGTRIRCADKANDIAVTEGLGAVVVPMAFSEAYTSIQQNIIDGAIGTFVGFTDYGFNEITNQCLDSQSWTILYSYMMNADFYNNLPEDLQQVVDEGIQEALKSVRSGYLEEREGAIERCEAAGCHFNALEGELAEQVAAAHEKGFKLREEYFNSKYPGFLDEVVAERQALSDEYYGN